MLVPWDHAVPVSTFSSALLCLMFLSSFTALIMNRLDPIEELYNMYSEEEDTPKIIEIEDDGLDFVSDVEGPADPYMDL